MKYLSTAEAAEKWGVTQRVVRMWCQKGLIPDIVLAGKSYQIPDSAQRPIDHRTIASRTPEALPDRLYLLMNPDYPTTDPFEQKIICMEQEYLFGHLQEAMVLTRQLLKICPDDSYRVVLYSYLYSLAVDMGQSEFVEGSKTEIFSMFEQFPLTRLYTSVFMSKADIPLPNAPIPQEVLPQMLLRSMRNVLTTEAAMGVPINLTHWALVCRQVELLGNEVVTAYFYLTLAFVSLLRANEGFAKTYIDKAAEIIFRRGWYMIIAEGSILIDWKPEKYITDQVLLHHIQQLTEMRTRNYLRRLVSDNELDIALQLIGNDLALHVQVMSFYAHRRSITRVSQELKLSEYRVRRCIDTMRSITHKDDPTEIVNTLYLLFLEL